MQVSVIVPVYNAADYVRQAAESALNQAETAEVILVEDGSPDNALQVCTQLDRECEAIKLVRHPNCDNRGAGASRNRGLQVARYNYISFLDADDYYLPNHFSVPKALLEQHPEVDGVYEAVGTHFESEAARNKWFTRRNYELTTVRQQLPPEALFDALIAHGIGHFHTDGITVRRSLFERTGLFDEHLKLRQDTAMWLKMAAVGRLVPGRLDEPVSMRRFHDRNRIATSRETFEHYGRMLWETLFQWGARHGKLDKGKLDLLFVKYVNSQLDSPDSRSPLQRRARSMAVLLKAARYYPGILKFGNYWRNAANLFGLSKNVTQNSYFI